MYNLIIDVRKKSEEIVSNVLQDIEIDYISEDLSDEFRRLFCSNCSIPVASIQKLLTDLSGVNSFDRIEMVNKGPSPYYAFIEN